MHWAIILSYERFRSLVLHPDCCACSGWTNTYASDSKIAMAGAAPAPTLVWQSPETEPGAEPEPETEAEPEPEAELESEVELEPAARVGRVVGLRTGPSGSTLSFGNVPAGVGTGCCCVEWEDGEAETVAAAEVRLAPTTHPVTARGTPAKGRSHAC